MKTRDSEWFTMMDAETLYNMAKAAAQGAQRICETGANSGPWHTHYGGYLAYMTEYNRLIPLTIRLFGNEAKALFPPLNLKMYVTPSSSPLTNSRAFAELAATRLSSLAAYLQGKLGSPARQVDTLSDVIVANLRAAMFQDPKTEKEICNTMEIIFRTKDFNYERERVSIGYSSKKFIPDFTFDSLDLVVEAKLCNSSEKKNAIVDEINADIPAYQTRYRRIIFVVYDLGFIRDVHQFKSSIESNPDVHVIVVKK